MGETREGHFRVATKNGDDLFLQREHFATRYQAEAYIALCQEKGWISIEVYEKAAEVWT